MQELANVYGAISQKPINFTVDVKVRSRAHKQLQKWGVMPKIKEFSIRPITYGALVRISHYLLSIDMKDFDVNNVLESNYRAISRTGDTLPLIIATAIENHEADPSKSLVQFIRSHLTTSEMHTILSIVLEQMDVKSFLMCIILAKGMNVLESVNAPATDAEAKPQS